MSRPVIDEVEYLLRRIWAAVGMSPDDVVIGAFELRRPLASCDGLPAEDRWLGEQRSYVPAATIDAAAAEAGIVGFLAAEGFAVRIFRSTHPASTARCVDGVGAGARVLAHLGEGRPTDINARVGPCAPSFGAVDVTRYELDPIQPGT